MAAKRRTLDEWRDDIAVAATKIARYTDPISYPEFLTDEPIQDLVIKKIEIMGEAAKHITRDHSDFAETYKNIPWSSLTRMRDRMAHGYWTVMPATLWQTAREDIPQVSSLIAAAISDRAKTLVARSWRPKSGWER